MKKYLQLLIFIFATLISGNCLQKSKIPKYIFLITLDTTRADYIDYSMVNNELSPNLAELAANGINFQNAYSLIPITLPSHYSMFYSLPPHIVKIYNNGQTNAISYPSLGQILKEKEFATGAVVSLASVAAKWGLNKGFDEYIEHYRKPYLWYKTAEEVNRDAYGLIRRFKGKKSFFWIHYSDPHEPYFPPFYGGSFTIKINKIKKFLSKSIERAYVDIKFKILPGKNDIELITEVSDLIEENKKLQIDYISYEDFRLTFDAPTKEIEIILPTDWNKNKTEKVIEYNTSERKSIILIHNKANRNIYGRLVFSYRLIPTIPSMNFLYQEEVKYMDYHIGELIEFLKAEGIYEESVFVIMGDHGEGLGEYKGHVGHIDYLHKIYSKVPLIVCGHGIQKEEVNEKLVSNLNIAPTILDIFNIKKPDFMLGDSLLRPLKNKKLLLETYSPEAPTDSFAIIDYPYQLIYYPERNENQLEFFNLENDDFGINNRVTESKESRKIKELLKSIREISEKLVSMKHNPSEISERDKEILKSLGYLK